MHLIFRTILVWLRRNGQRLGVHDVSRLHLRVLPTDIDYFGHVNNGMYLSIMDLGRQDLMQRSGILKKLTSRGWYPVMANETISFKRSLQPRQRFTIETRVIGYDDKAVYFEQRAVADGEIYAVATMRTRLVKKSGGTVKLSELVAVTGIDPTELTLPEWVVRWAADVALPPAGVPMPSDWS